MVELTTRLAVAVAAIQRADGRLLLARRAPHQHQGGRWEFPGGKVEPGESYGAALRRELVEELGIEVQQWRPLLHIDYDYPDRQVGLAVALVSAFDGHPQGREGQPLAWVAPQQLHHWSLPAANRPIVTALQLPDTYLITPEPTEPPPWHHFLAQLAQRLAQGITLFQLRAKSLPPAALAELCVAVAALARRYRVRWLLNGPAEMARQFGASGLHLSSTALTAAVEQRERPLPKPLWVAASCHNQQQLEQAVAIGADFAVLSPILPTASHPDAIPLGWSQFAALTARCPIPIYALGGMQRRDLPHVWQQGGQGVAAIRGLWS